jgi:hypothetical protein
MVAWRLDVQRVHIGQGIRLLFSLTDGVIAAGDTLQIVYPNHEQRQGTVISAVPADTVIADGKDIPAARVPGELSAVSNQGAA